MRFAKHRCSSNLIAMDLFAYCEIISGSSQFVDPMVGLLTPAVPPPILYAIRGPIYVEPASLQPAVMRQIGAPILDPYPQQISQPAISQPVLSPSPFNPYAAVIPMNGRYDNLIEEVRG